MEENSFCSKNLFLFENSVLESISLNSLSLNGDELIEIKKKNDLKDKNESSKDLSEKNSLMKEKTFIKKNEKINLKEPIENHLKNIKLNEELNKIKFLKLKDLDKLNNLTTAEINDYENKIKNQRNKFEINYFVFEYFVEKYLNEISIYKQSLDILYTFCKIKEEKINFWTKSCHGCYSLIEINNDKYNLYLKENDNLKKYTKKDFHLIIECLLNKISNLKILIKLYKEFKEEIDNKIQLINLNLVNLHNYKTRKNFFKFLETLKTKKY